MRSQTDIIADMTAVSSHNAHRLGNSRITTLTGELRDLRRDRGDMGHEFDYFTGVRSRGLRLNDEELVEFFATKKILVTGGTGCVGSTLLSQLAGLKPAKLASLSRGVTPPWQPVSGVDYLTADVQDAQQVKRAMTAVLPDVVIHVAAQREPGLGESEATRTVRTNIFGTRNVAETAAQVGASHFVYASTGKALRPYTLDVYAASKRIAEHSFAQACTAMKVGAVRFTHIVDNSLIFDRLRSWRRHGPALLHGPDIGFYIQSAREAGQLLTAAALHARAGRPWIHSVRDLGRPVDLLGLALDATSDDDHVTPIVFRGPEPGYETEFFPGLYDPATAMDRSPLFSSLETWGPPVFPDTEQIDAFIGRAEWDSALAQSVERLEWLCIDDHDPALVRQELSLSVRRLLECCLHRVPHTVRKRILRLSAGRPLADHHRIITDAIEESLRD